MWTLAVLALSSFCVVLWHRWGKQNVYWDVCAAVSCWMVWIKGWRRLTHQTWALIPGNTEKMKYIEPCVHTSHMIMLLCKAKRQYLLTWITVTWKVRRYGLLAVLFLYQEWHSLCTAKSVYQNWFKMYSRPCSKVDNYKYWILAFTNFTLTWNYEDQS